MSPRYRTRSFPRNQREQDRQVRDVLAAVREATVGFELATYPVATKP